MSKSYDNTIALILSGKQLRKHINKIKINLLEPSQPKDPKESQTEWMRYQFTEGIARAKPSQV